MQTLLILFFVVPAFSEIRTWTDSTGKLSVQAELQEVRDENVFLKIGDTIKPVPIDRLSTADQHYVSEHRSDHVLYGKVVAVTDGSRFVVRADQNSKVRLAGIDVPKGNLPGARDANRALLDRILGNQVRVEWKEKASDGTLIGQVFKGESWVNKELIADGSARFDKSDWASDELAEAESKARDARLGVWASEPLDVPIRMSDPRTSTKTSVRAVGKKSFAADQVTIAKLAVVVHPDWTDGKLNRASFERLQQYGDSWFSRDRTLPTVLGESINNAPADSTVVLVVNQPQFTRSTRNDRWSQINGQQGQFFTSAKTVELYVQYEMWYRPTIDGQWHQLGHNAVRARGHASELHSQSSGSLGSGGILTSGEYRRMSWKELEQAAFGDGNFGQAWINLQKDLQDKLARNVFLQDEHGRIIPQKVQIVGNSISVTIRLHNRLPFPVEGTITAPLQAWIDGARAGGDIHQPYAVEPGEKAFVNVSIPTADVMLLAQLQSGRSISGSVRVKKAEEVQP